MNASPSDSKQLWALLKVRLLSFWSINRARYSHDPKQRKRLTGMLILYVFVGGMLCFYMAALAVGYHAIGLDGALMPLICAGASLMMVISSILNAGTLLFGGEDASLVMSLPVKSFTVVLSRFITGYLFELMVTAVMTVPVAAVYFRYNPSGILSVILFALTSLFLPLLPMVVSNIIGTLIRLVTSRMRKSNLPSVILTFVFVFAIFALVYNPKNADVEYLSGLAQTASGLSAKLWPLAPMFGKACSGDIVSALVYIVLSTAAALVFLFAVSKFYGKIQSGLSARAASKSYKMTSLKSSGKLSALYRKELHRYLGCTVYVTNTGIGAIMMIAAAVAVFFIPKDTISSVFELSPGLSIAGIAPFALAILSGMTCTTSSSISLEGRQRWILLSLPLSCRDIYSAKMLVSFTVAMPASIISSILLTISQKPDPLTALMIFIVPLSMAFAVSALGLFANLKMQNYDWQTEVTVVKQSVPTMISIFAPMLLAGGAFAAAAGGGNSNQIAILLSLICLCAGTVFWRLALKININP